MKMESITATCSRDNSTYCLGILHHDGHVFEHGGGMVNEGYLLGYPHKDGTFRLWDGQIIGTYQWRSSREAIFFGHRSWVGSRYYYGRAQVRGAEYAIRGFGVGMLARGKRIKGK